MSFLFTVKFMFFSSDFLTPTQVVVLLTDFLQMSEV